MVNFASNTLSLCELEESKQLNQFSIFCSLICSFQLFIDLYHFVSLMAIYVYLKEYFLLITSVSWSSASLDHKLFLRTRGEASYS